MKTVIIGAGSAFGGRISVDILSRPPLQESEIALCDIDEQKLSRVHAYVQKVIDSNDLPATVRSSTDRRELLEGADAVVISVSIGGPAYYDEPFESEIRIPLNYGVMQTVGDTLGPGGIFRGLRCAPPIIDMVRDVNELAPNAVLLNYTNPMAILTWTIDRFASVPTAGLCHGVVGNARKLAELAGVPYEELEYTAAGINHMTWFIDFHRGDENILNTMHESIRNEHRKNPETYEFRNELLDAFGYFSTESDRHIVEYIPWFEHEDRKRLQPYLDKTMGIKGRRQKWYEDMGVSVEKADSVELIRSHESASGIIEAWHTGEDYRFSGNVINREVITNLPDGCCVEVPCIADSEGITPEFHGKLPSQCAALCRTNVNVQELVVEAILTRNRDKALQALLLDPSTGAVLTMQKTRELFEEMWKADAHLLEYYQ